MRPAVVGMSLHASAAYAVSSRTDLENIKPKVGDFVGYQFEWGPMIAGLLCCLAVRFYVRSEDPNKKIDYPITFLALCVTAGVIQATRPIPLTAILYGTGIGALGVGIVRIALSFVRKNFGPFDDDDDHHDEDGKPKA